MRRPVASGYSTWRVVPVCGLLFPLTVRALRAMFDLLGAGTGPALVWCIAGSAGAAWLFARWERRGSA